MKDSPEKLEECSLDSRGEFHLDERRSRSVWDYKELCRGMSLELPKSIEKLAAAVQEVWRGLSTDGRLWLSSDVIDKLLDIRERAFSLASELTETCYMDHLHLLQLPIGIEVLVVLLKREGLLREKELYQADIDHLRKLCERKGIEDDGLVEEHDYYPDFSVISGEYQEYVFRLENYFGSVRSMVKAVRERCGLYSVAEVAKLPGTIEELESQGNGEKFCNELSAAAAQIIVNILLRARANLTNPEELTEEKIKRYKNQCAISISKLQTGINHVVLDLLTGNILIDQEKWRLYDEKASLLRQIIETSRPEEPDEDNGVEPFEEENIILDILQGLEVESEMRFSFIDVEILESLPSDVDVRAFVNDYLERLDARSPNFDFAIIDLGNDRFQIACRGLDASSASLFALTLHEKIVDFFRVHALVGVTPLVLSEFGYLAELFTNHPHLDIQDFWRHIAYPQILTALEENHQEGRRNNCGGVTYRGRQFARADLPLSYQALIRRNSKIRELYPAELDEPTIELPDFDGFDEIELPDDQGNGRSTYPLDEDSVDGDWMETLRIDDSRFLPQRVNGSSAVLAQRVERYEQGREVFRGRTGELIVPKLKIVD